jgi:hypothetical protein
MLKKLLAESDVICDWSDPFAGEHGRFPGGPFPDHPAIPASRSQLGTARAAQGRGISMRYGAKPPRQAAICVSCNLT